LDKTAVGAGAVAATAGVTQRAGDAKGDPRQEPALGRIMPPLRPDGLKKCLRYGVVPEAIRDTDTFGA
jgi:hypothetical protein